MRILALIIGLFIFNAAWAQNTSFELSIEGGIPLLGTEDQAIQSVISYTGYPNPDDADKVRPFSVWNTKQIGFNFHLEKPKGLFLSFGLRTFQMGWVIDTIKLSVYHGSITPPTGYWEIFHARQDRKFGYVLPTIGAGYEFELFDHFWLRNSFSIGVISFARFSRTYTISKDGGQEFFEYTYGESGDLSFTLYSEKSVLDVQLQSAFSWKYKGLSICIGPSFYYFRQKSRDITYSGFHLNAGIAYRFKGKEK
jgi:hypothetical protein